MPSPCFSYRPTQLIGVAVLCICLALAAKQPAVAATQELNVVTDTLVIHSLVSMVMGDIASPVLLMPGNASPHDYTLRPSEAAALQSADLLIWTSQYLTPWLSHKMQTLAHGTPQLELMSAPQTRKLAFRQNSLFADSHDHEHGTSGPDNDDTHNADNAEQKDVIDPHGWLDPDNAIYWVELIAEQLATLDSQHAEQYRANAITTQVQISQLQLKVAKQLEPVLNKPFVVFHDSYHYFEERFNMFATAAIALSDAQLPSIRELNSLRKILDSYDNVCVFSEPQFSDKLVRSLTRDLDVSIAELDPLGSQLAAGPDLYMRTIEQLSDTLATCLGSLPSQ